MLTVWGLTDVRSRARIDPADPLVHKTDLTVYTEAGSAFFDGRNPYDVSNPRGWRYLYPPLFAILMSPLARLDSQWQAMIWFVVSLALAWGTWRESLRLWRLLVDCREQGALWAPWHSGTDLLSETSALPGTARSPFPRCWSPTWLAAMAAATLALPTLNCLQRGQVGVLIVYLVLLGIRMTLENRSWWGAAAGGSALAAAVAIKLTPALPAILLVGMFFITAWANRWAAEPLRRFTGTFAGLAVGLLMFFFVFPGLAVGNSDNIRHLRTWIDRVVVHHDMGEDNNAGFYSVRDQSLTNAVERLGNWIASAFSDARDGSSLPNESKRAGVSAAATPAVERWLTVARCALLLLLAIGAWRAARYGDRLDMAAVFGLAATATLLLSPLSWAHHYLIWLPGLLVVPAWLWRSGRIRLAKVLAVAPCVIMVAHYALLDWAGRAGLLGLGATAWFLTAAQIAAWGDSFGLGDCHTANDADARIASSRQAA